MAARGPYKRRGSVQWNREAARATIALVEVRDAARTRLACAEFFKSRGLDPGPVSRGVIDIGVYELDDQKAVIHPP